MKQTGAHRFNRAQSKGIAVTVYGEVRQRSFRRQDGTIFLLQDDAETREVPSHRALPDTWGEQTLERFGKWVRATQKRFDIALAVVCFFLVMGAIFMSFGGAAYLFFSDPSVHWTFWTLGLAMWIVSMTMFFSFMDWPLPRHTRER
jgi:hypothetical protein